MSFILGAVGSVIAGLAVWDDDTVLFSILSIVIGPIIAWVSSWTLYAFGELVESVSTLRQQSLNGGQSAEQTRPIVAKLSQKPYCGYALTDTQRQQQEVKELSIEELRARSANEEEWTESYRKLCQEELALRTKAPANTTWLCPQCQTKNMNVRADCWSCGYKKQ